MVIIINVNTVHEQIGLRERSDPHRPNNAGRCASLDLCHPAHSGFDTPHVDSLRTEGIVPLCWLRELVPGLSVVSQRMEYSMPVILHSILLGVNAVENSLPLLEA